MGRPSHDLKRLRRVKVPPPGLYPHGGWPALCTPDPILGVSPALTALPWLVATTPIPFWDAQDNGSLVLKQTRVKVEGQLEELGRGPGKGKQGRKMKNLAGQKPTESVGP